MQKKSIKFAVAQISTDAGNIKNNTEKIIQYIHRAKKEGANVVIFPELAIPGYMSLDLMLAPKYIEDNLKALQEIVNQTKDIMVIVGFIDRDSSIIGPDGTLIRYNSAAVAYNQKLLAVCDKTLLPDYDVFFENRYFKEGRGRKLIEYRGIKLGVQICEDLWDKHYPVKVSRDLVDKGADILINISGSPFYIGKRFDREKIIKKVSKNYHVPFIYVNTIGVQDGYDGELIFDGQSMIFNKSGQLIYLARQFEEELFYIKSDDLFCEAKQSHGLLLKNKRVKMPIINPTEELYKGLILAIKQYFLRTNFTKAFIGLSGGIDSAVVAVLTTQALGKGNVTGVYMPSSFSSKDSLNDSLDLAKKLGINLEVISIENLYGIFLDTLKEQFNKLPFDTTEENIQARIRGMILMAHANKLGGLVISTANKTETALGYTTLYGDMCGAIAPIADVSKLRVYDLAQYINKEQKVIPETIITKIPTAELRENQTDEASLGAPYKVISPLVDELIEGLATQKDLFKKYPKNVVKHIISLINSNEYKRRQAAPAVKVTKKAFGLGRRIPIAHQFKN